MQNERLLRALGRESVDAVPIWLMRQAGRYLPEYRAVRRQAGDFMSLCKNPELACEVAMQPLERFDFDAAILFSDILTIPDAMGLGLRFVEGEGPVFEHPLRTTRDIQQLAVPDVGSELLYVCQAVEQIRHALNDSRPLIGFSGSPWTLACYMVEGGSSRQFHRIKTLMYNEEAATHQLLETLSTSVSAYLNAQIESGVDCVMIFDTWGGILSTEQYQRFSLHYIARILHDLQRQSKRGRHVPVILFTKGGGAWLDMMADLELDGLGIDWTTTLKSAAQTIGERAAIQGNLDPAALLAKPDRIRREVEYLFQQLPSKEGYIFNLGHGITPDVPPEHVSALVEAVREFGRSS